MRGNQFSVIADECVLAPFVAAAVDVLARDGVELASVERLKWRQTKNGRLHVKAHEFGADALLTFDKRMANQTPPRIPVLVLDDFYPSHTGLVLPVLADILAARGFDEPDYYPVMVDGFDPEPELAKIAAGLYDMNPRHGGGAGRRGRRAVGGGARRGRAAGGGAGVRRRGRALIAVTATDAVGQSATIGFNVRVGLHGPVPRWPAGVPARFPSRRPVATRRVHSPPLPGPEAEVSAWPIALEHGGASAPGARRLSWRGGSHIL